MSDLERKDGNRKVLADKPQTTTATQGSATSREEWIAKERAYISQYVQDGETCQKLAEAHYEKRDILAKHFNRNW